MASVAVRRTLSNHQRRNRYNYLPWGITVILIVYLTLFFIASFATKDTNLNFIDDVNTLKSIRHKRDTGFSNIIHAENETLNATDLPSDSKSTTKDENQGIYPPDVFDLEKRRQGKA